jgi:ankyrin repeat protein
VAADADTNARTYDGRQPLQIAAACSSSAHGDALLAHGADVQAQCRYGLTPLHYAALHNRDNAVDCIHALVAAGADVAVVTCYGQQPLHLAAVGDTKAVAAAITALLEAGASTTARDAEGGLSPLHYAIMAFLSEGATAAIKTLLASGAGEQVSGRAETQDALSSYRPNSSERSHLFLLLRTISIESS